MTPLEKLALMLQEHAEKVAETFARNAEAAKISAEAVKKIAETASKSEQQIRFTLALFGATVAMQPGIDAKKLLADFDRQLEANNPPSGEFPIASLDVRAALAKVAEAKKS